MLHYTSVEIKLHIMLFKWMQYILKSESASMQLKLNKAVVTKVFIKDITLQQANILRDGSPWEAEDLD